MNTFTTDAMSRLSGLLEPWMPWAEDAMRALGAWFAQMPPVVWIGAGLWVAMRVADRVQRFGALRSTAYGGCGLLIALAALALFDVVSLVALAEQMQWLFDMALGWVLFTVGQRMDMRWLLRNKALAATAALEFAVTALAIAGLLIMLGLAWPAASIAGILAAHSSPVVLASFMPDWQADGQISARTLHLSGINTLLSALCLPLLLVMAQAWQQGLANSAAGSVGMASTVGAAASTAASLWSSLPIIQRSGWDLAQPLLLLISSLAVGAALGRLLAHRGQSTNAGGTGAHAGSDSMGLVAAACVCAGMAQWWGAPAWAACLSLGLALRSPSGAAWREGQGLQTALTSLSQLLLFGLSALTLVALWMQGVGRFTALDISLGMMIPLVALIMLLRLCAKLLVCTLTARWAGLRWQQGFLLGIAMQPLSMTGLALLTLAWPALMQADALLGCSLVVALLISDWISPLLLRTLLRRSGEVAAEPDIAGMSSRSSTRPTRVDTADSMMLQQIV
jgi:Kef-type K+ transport system membrane component KefB